MWNHIGGSWFEEYEQRKCLRDLRSTSPRGVFGYGVVEFPKEVDDEMMPVQVTFQADGDGIYPVKTSAPGWWDARDFKWEHLSERERRLVLDEMCPEGAIQ